MTVVFLPDHIRRPQPFTAVLLNVILGSIHEYNHSWEKICWTLFFFTSLTFELSERTGSK